MEKKYRKNVGAVIMNDRLFFAGQRVDVCKYKENNENIGWQFVQGGVEVDEVLDDAMYREIFEEIGLKKDKIKLLKKKPECLRYDFPIDVREKNKGTEWENYLGQEQYWYVFDFLGKNEDINLSLNSKTQEFVRWGWKTSEFIIKNIVEFKKNVYTELFDWMKNEKLIKD